MPRFGKAGDVWSIEQADKALTIVEAGKATVRRFVSAEHAESQLVKLVHAKLAAGYVALPAEPPPAPRKRAQRTSKQPLHARNLELEAAITARPDDIATWAVYGDWLAQRGDLRGELVALQLALEATPSHAAHRTAIREYLTEHGPALLHPLGRWFPSAGETGSLAWRRGFLHTITLTGRPKLPQLLADILAHPAAVFVEAIELRTATAKLATAACEVLAARAPRTLRDLVLHAPLGDLSALWAALPPLRALTVAGSYAHASDEVVDSIVRAPWPALERIRIDVSNVATLGPLAALFARADLPALTRVGLPACRFPRDVISALADGPLGPQIQILDFGTGSLLREDGEHLLALRSRLPKLRELWLHHPHSLGEALPHVQAMVKHVLASPPPVLVEDERRYDGIRE